MLREALFLLSYTTLGWWLFMYVLKPTFSFSFTRTSIRTSLYFLLLAAGIVVLWYPIPLSLFKPTVFAVIFIFGSCAVIAPLVYAYARKRMSPLVRHKDLELLDIKYPFLYSKLTDVLFQQTAIGTMVLLFASTPLYVLSVFCGVVFMFGHLGLLFRLPKEWTLYFLASALVGGATLPFLILLVPGGIYYAISLHLLWYVITGALTRINKTLKIMP